MSYQALARKWRPRQFSDVIGQQHVVSALTNALDNERVHHAYLFTGTRGVGKTTLARIFARALNCETGISSTPCGKCAACVGVDQGNFIDLLEVDAASRTRVDDTRELLDNVQYAPSQGRYKIYLIDEVHMLSTHSFNALLKTLEEPPPHVKFLLATTDPQKLPATILSRCIQFNLKAMDVDQLDRQLQKILTAEGIESDADARRILARSADGSVRDALSLLDQAVSFGNGEVRTEQVRSMLGMIDDRFVFALLEQIIEKDGAGLLTTVAQMAERTVDYGSALNDVLSALHYAALCQVNPQAVSARGVELEPIATLADRVDPERLQLLYQIGLMAKRDFSLGPDPRSSFEMAMLRMNAFQPAISNGSPESGSGHNKPQPLTQPSAPVSAAASNVSSIDRIRPEPAADNTGQTGRALSQQVSDQQQAEASNQMAELDSHAGDKDNPAVNTPTAKTRSNAATLTSKQGWAEFVEHCGLAGMLRELAMNMSPKQLQDGVLQVVLDQHARHLFNDSRQKQIEQYLGEQLGQSVILEIEITELGANAERTPAQIKHKADEQRQQSAEQAFVQDPNVQSLVDLFDAEIIPDSVRPSS